MGQGSARLFNLISLIFVVLTVVVLVFVGTRFAQPAPVPTVVAFIQPTQQVLPTITASFTPTNTPTETITPSITPSLTPTVTLTGTRSPVPTVTPSLTHTPSASPSIPATVPTSTITPVPSVTPTFTIGPSQTIVPSQTITATLRLPPTLPPTITPPASATIPFTPATLANVPSPFPFGLRDGQPIFTANFANAAGCAWQGIGGQVFDVNDQALLGVNVHVFGPGVDLFVTSGSNTIYGVSGWEVPLGTALSNNTYRVELQSPGGTIISNQVTVSFPGDCARNLALLNFKQNRPF